MKHIKLNKGYVAIVDDLDYELLSKFKWYALVCKRGVYAMRSVYNGYKKPNTSVLMHRHIMGVTDTYVTVDHKDGNPLNNTRGNLRVCSKAMNNKNKSAHRNSNSKYVGVYFSKRKNAFIARVTENRKTVFSRQFRTEIEAAVAYNNKAFELRGEFAKLNIINKSEYEDIMRNPIPTRKMRAIVKIHPITNEEISSYKSIVSAAKEHNIVPHAIYACCNGDTKTSAGYKWKFI